MRILRVLLASSCLAVPGFAQAPNTSALVVVVTDQSGAVVRDAQISVVNTQTGATREATSAPDGSATISGLAVGGPYSVAVAKTGFSPESSGNLTLPRVIPMRSGDTYRGDDWIGLKMRDASVVRGIGVLPMFAGLLGLLLLVGALAATWAREGR